VIFLLKEVINYYNEFKTCYFQIVESLGINYSKDIEARDFLTFLLKDRLNAFQIEKHLNSFKQLLKNKNIIIYGCGPSLETTINSLLEAVGKKIFKNCINLAADGASRFLKEKKIPIQAIFTDLDGITRNEFYTSNLIIVHAHGDNIDKMKAFKEEIINSKNIIGTTQVEPNEIIINPGGFTDGDRIIFFLRPFLKQEHSIYLIGMDFKNIIGKYSKPNMTENKIANEIKIKKLKIALNLLIWIKDKLQGNLYFINSKIDDTHFKYLSIDDFIDFVNI